MALTLWFHPFSSYCQKVLIALHECDARFDPVIVDLGDEASRNAFLAVWPIGKFPVIRDEATDETIPESTIIIEYLAARHPQAGLIPPDGDAARDVRLWDRFFDNYVHLPMQKIVADRLRPDSARDPHGVAEARAQLDTAYGVIDRHMATRRWASGEGFSMADCSAAPPLHYAWQVAPWQAHPALSAYFDRLNARPSVSHVFAEAAPYAHLLPRG